MRKIFIPIAATITLILCCILCACTNYDINIENTNWQLQIAIQADVENQESQVIARNNEWVVEDATIPIVNVTLVANDNTITIANNIDTNKSFVGTYEKVDTIGVETVVYKVTINELSGNANVSTTKYNDGVKIKVLVLTLFKDDIQYTLNFISKN